MLSTEEFRAVLNNCGIKCLSQLELQALLDSETEKQYDRINADFIEYCLDLLSIFEDTSSSAPQQDRITEHEYKCVLNNFDESFILKSYMAASEHRSIGF